MHRQVHRRAAREQPLDHRRAERAGSAGDHDMARHEATIHWPELRYSRSVAGDVEPTQADATDADATEAGTEAASPRALAEVAAMGSHAQPSGHESKPTGWATASHRPTAAQALDRSDLARSRMFHMFGVGAPLAAIALSMFLGGDPVARVAFWIGAARARRVQRRVCSG